MGNKNLKECQNGIVQGYTKLSILAKFVKIRAFYPHRMIGQMEYKVNIHGISDVDLYADANSAKKLVASVSGENAAKNL